MLAKHVCSQSGCAVACSSSTRQIYIGDAVATHVAPIVGRVQPAGAVAGRTSMQERRQSRPRVLDARKACLFTIRVRCGVLIVHAADLHRGGGRDSRRSYSWEGATGWRRGRPNFHVGATSVATASVGCSQSMFGHDPGALRRVHRPRSRFTSGTRSRLTSLLQGMGWRDETPCAHGASGCRFRHCAS